MTPSALKTFGKCDSNYVSPGGKQKDRVTVGIFRNAFARFRPVSKYRASCGQGGDVVLDSIKFSFVTDEVEVEIKSSLTFVADFEAGYGSNRSSVFR